MTTEESKATRNRRWARRRDRRFIDGRWVSITAPTHGVQWVYASYFCRCPPCTQANTDFARIERRRRYAERVEIDGQLVHPRATHGMPTAYALYGCRCDPCREAVNASRRSRST